MNEALWIAATGMESQQMLTSAIANNMANVNTTSYKRSTVQFEDLLYQTVASPGSANSNGQRPTGIQLGTGVRTAAVTKNFRQGNLKNSSSNLDVAIEGSGFFEVSLPDGTSGYTRAGSFHMNANGEVVTSDGHPITGFPVLDPKATAIDIAPDGTVSVTVDGVSTEKGRIQLVRFPNAEGLDNLGRNLYGETEASGAPSRGNPGENGYGTVAQYFLESSNVEIINEMVDMIAAQRAYELLSKGIRTADEMLRIANNIK